VSVSVRTPVLKWYADGVNLTEWARLQDLRSQTAYRWFREGKVPVPAVRVGSDVALAPARACRRWWSSTGTGSGG
jgi:hypothetical protein